MDTANKGKNLAGIIPLSGWKNKLDFPWPDYLHLLGKVSLQSIDLCTNALTQDVILSGLCVMMILLLWLRKESETM